MRFVKPQIKCAINLRQKEIMLTISKETQQL